MCKYEYLKIEIVCVFLKINISRWRFVYSLSHRTELVLQGRDNEINQKIAGLMIF